MWKTNQLTEKLSIAYPIIQGPFGGGLSTVQLVANVTNAGGLGSYGAHMLSPNEIHEVIATIRNATRGSFVINLWVSDHDEGGLEISDAGFEKALQIFKPYFDLLAIDLPTPPAKVTERFEDQVEAVLDTRPPVFSFVFGIPSTTILDECRKRDILTLGAATTVDEANALAEAGVDMVLATGFEAGGHRVSFLKPAEESLVGTMALVPQVVDSVDIPVVAAGGIADGRGIAAALTLGAQAVQLGTAFLACAESGTSQIHRDSLFGSDTRHTVLTRAFTGRLARFLPNRFIREMEQQKQNFLPFPLQSWFTGHLKATAREQHNSELSALYASQTTPLLRYKQATELLDALIADVDHIINRC